MKKILMAIFAFYVVTWTYKLIFDDEEAVESTSNQATKGQEEKQAKPADKVSKITQVENNLTPLQRQALERKNKFDAEESIRLSWKRESTSYRCGIDYTFHFYRDLVTSSGLTDKYPSPPKDGEVNRYDWYQEYRASGFALLKHDWYEVKKVGDSKAWTQTSPSGEAIEHEFNLSTKTLFRGSQEGKGWVTEKKCKEIETK